MGCAESTEMPLKLAAAKRSLILNLSISDNLSSESSPGLNSPTYRKLALRTLVRFSETVIFRSLYISFKLWKRGKIGRLNLSGIPFGEVTFSEDTFNVIYSLKEPDDLIFFKIESPVLTVFEAKFKTCVDVQVIEYEQVYKRTEVFTYLIAKKIITQTEQLLQEDVVDDERILREISEVEEEKSCLAGLSNEDHLLKSPEVLNKWINYMSKSNLLLKVTNIMENIEKIENSFTCCSIKIRTRPLVPALCLENLIIEDDKKINATETKDAVVNTSFSLHNDSLPQYSFKKSSNFDSFHSSEASGKCSPDIQPQPSPLSLTLNFNDSCEIDGKESVIIFSSNHLKVQNKFIINPQSLIQPDRVPDPSIYNFTPLIKQITLPETIESKAKEILCQQTFSNTINEFFSPCKKSELSSSFESESITKETTENFIKNYKKSTNSLTSLLTHLSPAKKISSPLTLNQVLKIFEDLMDKKYTLDQKELRDQVKPRELAEFFPDYLNRNFGIQKVGQKMLGKFLLSLKSYSSHPYISLLCRFLRVECEEPVSLNLLVYLCKARNDFNLIMQKNLTLKKEKNLDLKKFKEFGGSVSLVSIISYINKEFIDSEVLSEIKSKLCPSSLKFEEYLIFLVLNKRVKSGLSLSFNSSQELLSLILASIDFILTSEQTRKLTHFVLASDLKQQSFHFSFNFYKSARHNPKYQICKSEFLQSLISAYETFKYSALVTISSAVSKYSQLDRSNFLSALNEIEPNFSIELQERLFNEAELIDKSNIITEQTFTHLLIQSGVCSLKSFRNV